MSRGGLLAAVLTALVVSACASAPPSREAARLALDLDNCASGWHALKVNQPLFDTGKKRRAKAVPFETVAECVRTQDGRSVPAAVFAIDGQAAPLELHVELTGKPEGTLAAALLLLDGEYRPLRRHGYAEFNRRGTDRDLSVFINPSDASVRYLVVTPDPEFLGNEEESLSGQRWTTVWAAAGVMGSYSDGVERRVAIPLTDTGTLRVVVRPWQTEPIQRK